MAEPCEEHVDVHGLPGGRSRVWFVFEPCGDTFHLAQAGTSEVGEPDEVLANEVSSVGYGDLLGLGYASLGELDELGVLPGLPFCIELGPVEYTSSYDPWSGGTEYDVACDFQVVALPWVHPTVFRTLRTLVGLQVVEAKAGIVRRQQEREQARLARLAQARTEPEGLYLSVVHWGDPWGDYNTHHGTRVEVCHAHHGHCIVASATVSDDGWESNPQHIRAALEPAWAQQLPAIPVATLATLPLKWR